MRLVEVADRVRADLRVVDDVEQPRVALAGSARVRSAMTVIAARQSWGSGSSEGTTTSPITASFTSVRSSSLVRT